MEFCSGATVQTSWHKLSKDLPGLTGAPPTLRKKIYSIRRSIINIGFAYEAITFYK